MLENRYAQIGHIQRSLITKRKIIKEGSAFMKNTRKTKQLREIEPILSCNGYKLVRCKGSHFIYMNRTTHKIISVNKDLNKMVRRRIVKENKLQKNIGKDG